MFGCTYYGQMIYAGAETRYGVQGSATIEANMVYSIILEVKPVNTATIRVDLL